MPVGRSNCSAGVAAPTVAQALVPFPQYCGGLIGENENEGTSHYNSFQAKYGRNFSGGFYLEANYTYSRLTTDAASTTQSTRPVTAGSGRSSTRTRAAGTCRFPRTTFRTRVSMMAVYDLPFGKGKQFLNNEGVMGHVLGGWTLAIHHEVHLRHAVLFPRLVGLRPARRSSRRLAFRRSRARCWRNRGETWT